MFYNDEKNDYSVINENIAAYRTIRGYKQSDIADILDMKQSTYSQMERKGNIPAITLWKISKILDIPMEMFFTKNSLMEPIDNPLVVDKEKEVDPFRPLNNKEKNAITILRNFSKPKQDEVYNLILKIYRRK